MQLALPSDILAGYKSASQRARVATEAWAEANAYCAECASNSLNLEPRNTHAIDFRCPACNAPFQLKGRTQPIRGRITDAAYSAMCHAIETDSTPNLFIMHYGRDDWSVRDLILVPRFAFPLSAVERRKPLAATARRAGWVGCNIVLDHIPEDARIPIIKSGLVRSPASVRQRFAELKKLGDLDVEMRGWTLDVMRIVRELGKAQFSLTDVYERSDELSRLHPNNRHVHDKIRQQLQILRDLGILHFLGRGEY